LEYFFKPDNAIQFLTSELQDFLFGIACFIFGIPIVLLYSYITNKGFIRKADKLYQKGSFQDHPKKFNIFLSGVLVILFFPLLVLSFNNYTYYTDNAIVVKGVFAINEKSYDYSEIDYIEVKEYSNGKYDYIAVTKSGKEIEIVDSESTISQELENIIKLYDIPLRYTKAWSLFRQD